MTVCWDSLVAQCHWNIKKCNKREKCGKDRGKRGEGFDGDGRKNQGRRVTEWFEKWEGSEGEMREKWEGSEGEMR